jgi:hypothetical protein
MMREGLAARGQTSRIGLGYPVDGQVAHLPCDGHRVVREALVVTSDEGGVDCRFYAMGPAGSSGLTLGELSWKSPGSGA